MSREPLSPFLNPDDGERLQWDKREVLLKVDPERTGSPFAMGVETIQSGGEIATRRLLHWSQLLFVHKGQGRAIVEGRSFTLVPGVSLSIPPSAWHGVRNTGTGALRVAWVVWPGGIEAYYRELSRLGSSDAVALHALAQRHGIEFRPLDSPRRLASPSEAAGVARLVPSAALPRAESLRDEVGARRDVALPEARGRPASCRAQHSARGERSRGTTEWSPGLPRHGSGHVAVGAPQGDQPVASTAQRGAPSRRRRGRRHRAGASPPSGTPGARPAAPGARGGVARPAPPSSPSVTPKPQAAGPPPQDRTQRRPSSHVREVYMEGRWIRVVGEGPVIAPGHARSHRGRRRARR